MPGWVHHIDITVSDMAASTAFYERVMPVMDFHRIADTPTGEPLWAGDRMELCLMRAQPALMRPHDRYSPGLHHVAWKAVSRADVDAMHELVVRLGATVLDAPADYPKYGEGYCAVFFADPDGLKLEYVYRPGD